MTPDGLERKRAVRPAELLGMSSTGSVFETGPGLDDSPRPASVVSPNDALKLGMHRLNR